MGLLIDEWSGHLRSELALAVDARGRAKLPIVDLITANPQEHGFAFPDDLLVEIMAEATRATRVYHPDPRGQLQAREAVAEYHGDGVGPENVVLTPGTSLGYFYAFRLLANPGDEVLIPSPTYPLFDDLARLAGLKVRRYHLHASSTGNEAHQRTPRWSIDPEEVAFQISPRTKLLCMVSPHNPTGMIATAEEMTAISDIAARRRVAIIFDEVFREFTHPPGGVVPRPADSGAPLVITLNGISKMLSLPGLKGAWMVVEGADRARLDAFLSATEYLSDTLLPVSEITQAALPRLLYDGLPHATQCADLLHRRMCRVVHDLNAIFDNPGEASSHAQPILLPDGAPYVVIPASGAAADVDDLAVQLVRQHGILLHPGSLYKLPFPALVGTAIADVSWPVADIRSVLASASGN